MDPSSSDASFTASLYKWEPRPHVVAGIVHNGVVLPQRQPQPAQMVAAAGYSLVRPREMGELEEMFEAYGVRYYTAAKIAELGFTVSTLVDMREEELDDMMNSLTHIFRWDLMVGERYGIKAAVRAERRRLDEGELQRRNLLLGPNASAANAALDALSHEGLSEEPEQQAEKEAAGSRGGGAKGIREVAGRATGVSRLKQVRKKGQRNMSAREDEENEYDIEEGICERQREHPFIVTEPGEVARGKKNGLDYLFHLYEQCREFLMQVQTFAKERGEKCPSKVTNQVFRHAKRAGASYINKPKMRHYVHCYAFHCLDEEASNALRRSFKERGENVGAWRQACYKPLVLLAARQGWDIDAIFNSHPRLAIWYVPTKLRQLCHAERSSASASSSVDGTGHLCFSTLDTKFH